MNKRNYKTPLLWTYKEYTEVIPSGYNEFQNKK